MTNAALWSAGAAIIGAGGTIYTGQKQNQEAAKARREQRAQIAKATAEANAEKQRLANIEKERLERLRKRGTGLPPSLITGMSGVTGPGTTVGPVLGA